MAQAIHCSTAGRWRGRFLKKDYRRALNKPGGLVYLARRLGRQLGDVGGDAQEAEGAIGRLNYLYATVRHVTGADEADQEKLWVSWLVLEVIVAVEIRWQFQSALVAALPVCRLNINGIVTVIPVFGASLDCQFGATVPS